jgi:hypothetical protein
MPKQSVSDIESKETIRFAVSSLRQQGVDRSSVCRKERIDKAQSRNDSAILHVLGQQGFRA